MSLIEQATSVVRQRPRRTALVASAFVIVGGAANLWTFMTEVVPGIANSINDALAGIRLPGLLAGISLAWSILSPVFLLLGLILLLYVILVTRRRSQEEAKQTVGVPTLSRGNPPSEDKIRADRLGAALAVVLTWLYRREKWRELSHAGRTSEAAPWEVWSKRRYSDLGLDSHEPYLPPADVASEPGWTPPSDFVEPKLLPGRVTTDVIKQGEVATKVISGDAGASNARPTDPAISAAGVGQSPRPLPPTIASLPPNARPQFEKEYEDLVALRLADGKAISDRILKIPASTPERDRLKWQRTVDPWILRVIDLERRWWQSTEVPGLSQAALKMTTPAMPPPKFRAQLLKQIEVIIGWLDDRVIRGDAAEADRDET